MAQQPDTATDTDSADEPIPPSVPSVPSSKQSNNLFFMDWRLRLGLTWFPDRVWALSFFPSFLFSLSSFSSFFILLFLHLRLHLQEYSFPFSGKISSCVGCSIPPPQSPSTTTGFSPLVRAAYFVHTVQPSQPDSHSDSRSAKETSPGHGSWKLIFLSSMTGSIGDFLLSLLLPNCAAFYFGAGLLLFLLKASGPFPPRHHHHTINHQPSFAAAKLLRCSFPPPRCPVLVGFCVLSHFTLFVSQTFKVQSSWVCFLFTTTTTK